MTLLTVQIILGVLGLVTGLLIALFGPGSRWIRWPLAIAAGAGVAITAWPGLWVSESSPEYQLYQSLMLASVVVLMALLAIMLIYPRRSAQPIAPVSDKLSSAPGENIPSLQRDEPTSQQVLDDFNTVNEPGRDGLHINLEQRPDTMIINQEEHALMHMMIPDKKSDAGSPDELYGFDQPTRAPDALEDTLLLVPGKTESTTPSDRSALVDTAVTAFTDDTSPENVVSLAERRERRVDEDAASALKLSDSDELYEAMREAEAELDIANDELDLSDESSWVHDSHEAIGGLDDAEDQLRNDHAIISSGTTDSLNQNHADIEDAEFDLIDEAELCDLDETTAEWDANEKETTLRIGSPVALNEKVPVTLQEALHAQRDSIDQLNTDTDTLTARLTEWGELANSQEQSAWIASLRQSQALEQQTQRSLAEKKFRESAIDLIHTQRDVMRQLMNQINSLGIQRKKDLQTLTAMQKSTLNQRRLAREAALLARKAAAETQSLHGRLNAERQNQERAQGAAKRAIVIARNAIDKLAEHERRIGIPSERAKSDNGEAG